MAQRIVEKIELHDKLNPKLWEDSKLRPEVEEKLYDIIDQFILELQSNEIPIKILDVRLVGSNASFNYTEDSDLDVHFVANFEDASCDTDTLGLLYNFFKKNFNDKYEITIHKIPVELYIEDVHAATISNGVYSLFKEEWIKFPEPIEIPDIDITDVFAPYKERYEDIINRQDLEAAESLVDELYLLRKDSISTEGEYGEGNLIFKEFRNLGYIENLKELMVRGTAKELSLEALEENLSKEYDKFNSEYVDRYKITSEPTTGSGYILPDGSFLTLNKKTHRQFFQDLDDIKKNYNFYQPGRYLIKYNDGLNEYDPLPTAYIDIEERPNTKEIEAIGQWTRELGTDVEVSVENHYLTVPAERAKSLPRIIQRYFDTGKLTEGLNPSVNIMELIEKALDAGVTPEDLFEKPFNRKVDAEWFFNELTKDSSEEYKENAFKRILLNQSDNEFYKVLSSYLESIDTGNSNYKKLEPASYKEVDGKIIPTNGRHRAQLCILLDIDLPIKKEENGKNFASLNSPSIDFVLFHGNGSAPQFTGFDRREGTYLLSAKEHAYIAYKYVSLQDLPSLSKRYPITVQVINDKQHAFAGIAVRINGSLNVNSIEDLEGSIWQPYIDLLIDAGYYFYKDYLTEEVKKDHTQAAIEYFGTTYYKNQAGFLTPNGRYIDLTFGGHPRDDHRAIVAIFDDDEWDTPTDALTAFMREGNIKLIPEIGGVSIIKEPTPTQYDALQKYVGYYLYKNNEFFVDIEDEKGDLVDGRTFDRSNRVEGVLRYIYDMFHHRRPLSEESGDWGYHYGDLGKADFKHNFGNRHSGGFGTGTYFVGKPIPDDIKKTATYGYAARPEHRVDFSKYKLFKPATNESAYNLHDALLWLNNHANEDIVYDPEAVWKDYNEMFDKVYPPFPEDESDPYQVNKDMQVVLKFIRKYIKFYTQRLPKDADFDDVMDIAKDIRSAAVDEATTFRQVLWNLQKGLDHSVSESKLLPIVKEALKDKSDIAPATLIMKKLGYDGVDVRHLDHDAQGLSGLDNFGYGSVIYDL